MAGEHGCGDPPLSGHCACVRNARHSWTSLFNLDIPDNLSVNGARDAVLQLQVHLGYGVLREDGGIRDVTCRRLVSDARFVPRVDHGKRTNGSRLDHVADGEALDGLVLGRASRAVAATNGLDMAAAVLVTSAEVRSVHALYQVLNMVDLTWTRAS